MIEVVHLEGLPQVRKMLDQFEGQELQNKMRIAVRAGLKPFQKTLAFEGDTPGHPHSFTKVPAGKVTTRGGASGREIEGYVRPKSPLFNIFEPGARAHTIKPGKVHRAHAVRGGRKNRGQYSGPGAIIGVGPGVLAGKAGGAGWSAEGRKRQGAFFARGPVTHPGMAPRPILPAAFAAGEQAATDAIANAIFHIAEASRRLVS